ncbi:radical SAM family heme chaperone HemW [Fictibacillus aquaticus]|uniref:Heme chaperone HemW n=1 Tax=Fictibacillus aquaticus TaxID=2021314 RepID=A0A235F9I1_9BACL|nr:radical SAM family heme chaperone HemW [Fictibacillus aquaticus]OYD57966.1 coproporphyrinogen III oxidase [Fictibacillus aquaticus]
MPKAAYFHIPFCVNICHYCDFNKVFLKGQPVMEYLACMDTEMERTIQKFPYEKMDTLFIGGGTPTALSAEQLDIFLAAVARHFPVSDVKEYTVEANPEQTTKEKLEVLKKHGVNRLSIGAQAFQPSLLKELGRTHHAGHVEQTVSEAKAIGIDNLSIDLMFGLPGQTMDMFKETIAAALALNVPHISSYSLQVEPKTIFYIRSQKGDLKLPPQELEAEMFEYLMTELERNGYHQYEISNFAKPGYESLHNLQYWDNNEYYGIGAGAHSYMNGVRRVNAGPLKKYMNLVQENGFPYTEENKLTEAERMEEELFMGLRKRKGISSRTFEARYGKPLCDVFGRQIEMLIDRGLLEKDGDWIRLTHSGILLGNEVFSEFISAV